MFSIRSFFVVLILSFVCVSVYAQANWLWATKGTSGGQDAANAVVVDASGNKYYTGYFSGQLQFTSNSANSAGGTDVFVAKVDPYGNVLWVNRGGGGYNDIARDICIDQNGNIWITGEYLNGAYFGTTYLQGSGGMDIFVAKISPTGTWLNAYRATCNNYAYSYGIAVNSANDIVIVGAFMSQISFGSQGGSSSGGTDAFLAILSQSGNWGYLWTFGSTGMEYVYDVITAPNYENYICGAYGGTLAFGSNSLYLNGSRDAFVMKHSPNVGLIWARGAGASGTTEAMALCNDSSYNIYFTGHFNYSAGFGSTVLNTVGNDDVFVASLNTNGLWIGAQRAGGVGYDFATDIAYGVDNLCHICGYYTAAAAFGGTNLPYNSNYQIFYAKSIATYGWVDAKAAGGPNSDYAYAITTDNKDYAYLGGSFYGSATFGPISLTGTSSDDVWFAKFDSIVLPSDPVLLYPANQAANLPPNLTLVWKYTTGNNNPPPSRFDVYVNGYLLNSPLYNGDQIYAVHLNLNYGQTCTWQIKAVTSAGVNCQNPPSRGLGIMTQPPTGQVAPNQVVYNEITQTGSSTFGIVLPYINLLGANVSPSLYLTPGAYLNNQLVSVEMQDKSSNAMPNASACLCAFKIRLPQGVSMQIGLNTFTSTTSTELLHWNGSTWEDISSTATFGAGTVNFSYTSSSRGVEEFALNDGSGSTLPVQLSSFAAIASSNNLAQLNWSTASETALLGFNLYRNQSDQLDNALRINGAIIEATNSSTTQHYSYIDPEAYPNTTYYYWLQCLDMDGGNCYFGPVSICLAPAGENPTPPVELYGIQSIYPNPFNPSTRLDFCLKTAGNTRILLYNSRAQLVKELDLGYILADTQQRITIDAIGTNGHPLASGIYVLKLMSGNYVSSRRIILTK